MILGNLKPDFKKNLSEIRIDFPFANLKNVLIIDDSPSKLINNRKESTFSPATWSFSENNDDVELFEGGKIYNKIINFIS